MRLAEQTSKGKNRNYRISIVREKYIFKKGVAYEQKF